MKNHVLLTSLLLNLMENLYRIEELYTAGWALIDESASKLTKEQCDERLQYYIGEGYNPNYLRAVPDND